MQPYKLCSCRNSDKKLLGQKCPELWTIDGRTGKPRYSPTHGRWYIKYEAPRSAGGGRRRPRLGPFDRREDAEDAAQRLAEGTRQNGYSEDRKLLVGEHLDRMLEHHWKHKKPTTFERAKLAVDRYFKPGIGHLRIVDLDEDVVEDLYAAMRKINTPAEADDSSDLLQRLLDARATREKGGRRVSTRPVSESTLKRHNAVLVTALNAKRVKRILPINPAEDITFRPRRVKPLLWTPERVERWKVTGKKPARVMVWTREDALNWLEFSSGDRLAALWRLATCWGPRRGELVGMERPDVRTSARKITVRASDADVEDGETKSEHSDRTFDIDEPTAQALEDWFAQQMDEQMKWGDAWIDSGRAFTMENGEALRLEYVTERFNTLVKRAGLPPIRLHDLRHVAATLLLAAGNDMKVVSETLGHASVAFTSDVYTSVLSEVKARAAVKLDDYLRTGVVAL